MCILRQNIFFSFRSFNAILVSLLTVDFFVLPVNSLNELAAKPGLGKNVFFIEKSVSIYTFRIPTAASARRRVFPVLQPGCDLQMITRKKNP